MSLFFILLIVIYITINGDKIISFIKKVRLFSHGF